jgi:WD40 repeat protein
MTCPVHLAVVTMASTAEEALTPSRAATAARPRRPHRRSGGSRRRGAGTPPQYDLFVSHSRALDARMAEAVQRGVETFAKPWWQPRSLRVFRDVSSLSANPHLWGSIEAALARTRYLLLLASPRAAASPWVRKELEWWIAHRGTGTLLLAVTAGRVPWSEPAGDDAGESCIPTDLEALYTDPPRWVDLRALRTEAQISRHNPVLVDAVADIGAAVRGVDKDELVGEHIRQNRRVRRTAWSAVTLLALLTVATVVAAFLFAVQRNTAREQARIATARQFAAVADSELGDRIDQSMLLAAKAYELHPEPRTYAAAFRAATASPGLVAVTYTGSPVSAVTATPEGDLVVVGEEDGTIGSWEVGTGRWTRYGRLPQAVTSVSTSADGATVAASDGHEVDLLRRDRPPVVLTGDPGGHLAAVALSPEAVFWSQVTFDDATYADTTTVTARRLADGSAVRATVPGHGLSELVADASTLTGFDGGQGYWIRWSLPDLRPVADVVESFGAHNYASAMSDDGASFSWTNSGATVPVWDTPGARGGVPPGASDPSATRWGRSRGVSPDAMALSRGGRRLAVSDAGTVYVSEPVTDENAATISWQLHGLAGVGVRNLRFLDDDRLVSTGQRQLAVWDLQQVSPLTTWQWADVPSACVACSGVSAALSPDGRWVASLADAVAAPVVVHDFRSQQDSSYEAPGDSEVGPPAWAPDGRHVLVPRGELGSVDVVDAATATRVATWPSDGSKEEVIAARLTSGGTRYLTVGTSGRATVRDARSGRVLRRTPPLPPAYRLDEDYSRRAAIDAQGTRMALSGQRGGQTGQYGVETVDLATGVVTRLLGTAEFVHAVNYAGDRLLVSGSSERARTSWIKVFGGADGTTLVRDVDTGPGMLEAAVGSETGPLIAYQALDGSVTLLDATTGDPVGSFPLQASTEALKTGLVFERSGRRLVTVSEGDDDTSGYIETWSVDPRDVTSTLCRLAGRTLTAEEWRSLAGGTAPDLSCG